MLAAHEAPPSGPNALPGTHFRFKEQYPHDGSRVQGVHDEYAGHLTLGHCAATTIQLLVHISDDVAYAGTHRACA